MAQEPDESNWRDTAVAENYCKTAFDLPFSIRLQSGHIPIKYPSPRMARTNENIRLAVLEQEMFGTVALRPMLCWGDLCGLTRNVGEFVRFLRR